MEAILHRIGAALNYQQEMVIAALMATRSVAMVVQTPWLGGKNIPPEVKIAIGVMITVLVWPLARTTVPADFEVNALSFVLLMLKEAFIGFIIGFAAAIFDAFEVAGRIIDTVRGSSMSEVMVPLAGERATPFGDIFFQLLLVIFMAMGGHRVFIMAYAHSFEVLALDKHLDYAYGLGPLVDVMAKICSETLFIGVMIAGPVIGATFLADLVFGILNRVAPSLNAYFLSMPVKAMAGIIMVLIAVEPLTIRMMEYVKWSLQMLEEVVVLFQYQP